MSALHGYEDVCYTTVPVILAIVLLFVLAITAAALIIKAILFCKIFSNAGYHWAWGLLVLVPIACIVILFILAFGQWPVRKELEQFRQQQDKGSS